jgi:hypothetical protein
MLDNLVWHRCKVSISTCTCDTKHRPSLGTMSGELHFVNFAAGKPETEEQIAQKALIRSHVMKHYRQKEREKNARRRESAHAASYDDASRVSSYQTGQSQVASGVEKCADGSRQGRCCLHYPQPQDDVHLHATDSRAEQHSADCYVTSGSFTSPAKSALDGIIFPWDCQAASIYAGNTALPPILHSQAAIRGPLLQAFVQGFFPSRDWTRPALVEGLNHWAVGKSLSMQLVIDAIGLMQLGVASHDRRLFTEGRRRQVLAVQSLRADLCKPDMSLWKVSCAAINITCSGLYSATSSGSAGCAGHLAGVTAILQAHSRQANAEPLTLQLQKHYHRLILMHHLINRTAISVSDRILGADHKAMSGSVAALVRLASGLPSLMEATAYLFDKGFEQDSGSETQALQALASALADEFNDWLKAYERPGFKYRRSPLEFPSFVDANMLGLYWCARLLLAESQYRLQMIQPLNPSDEETEDLPCYKDEAEMYAIYLLETAMAVDKYEGTTLSRTFAMRAPLHFARQWWSFTADQTRLKSTTDLEMRLRADLPDIDWETVLYYSFLGIMWFV